MEAIATIQHFAVDTAFITAIKKNSRALNTRILEEAHLKEFQETPTSSFTTSNTAIEQDK